MSKPWVGYLSSFLLLLASALMFAGGETVAGILFLLASVAGLILRIYISRNSKP